MRERGILENEVTTAKTQTNLRIGYSNHHRNMIKWYCYGWGGCLKGDSHESN